LAGSKERTYYKAVQRAASALNSDTAPKQILDTIVRATARATKAGVSLVLPDATRKKLIHSSSWGLPQYYLRKNMLDADKSLAEVLEGQPVAIANVNQDSRVQYPGPAAKAGITSMLGVPLIINGTAVGSLRVYSREPTEFSNEDINFVTAMANLASVAIQRDALRYEKEAPQEISQAEAEAMALRHARTAIFAHPSEEEFAHILDFYNIEWVYEPHSFPLNWEGDRITEMFTPDFYLPGLDLYVELTTLKQSLVTEKNRKLRRLRELYPEIKITLLYKKDFDRLLAKFISSSPRSRRQTGAILQRQNSSAGTHASRADISRLC